MVKHQTLQNWYNATTEAPCFSFCTASGFCTQVCSSPSVQSCSCVLGQSNIKKTEELIHLPIDNQCIDCLTYAHSQWLSDHISCLQMDTSCLKGTSHMEFTNMNRSSQFYKVNYNYFIFQNIFPQVKRQNNNKTNMLFLLFWEYLKCKEYHS